MRIAGLAAVICALGLSALLAQLQVGSAVGLPWIVGAALAQLALLAKGAKPSFTAASVLFAGLSAWGLSRYFEVVLSVAWPDILQLSHGALPALVITALSAALSAGLAAK